MNRIEKRCMNDPIFFIENCCTLDDGSPIDLMDHQKLMIESYVSNQKTVICNARQVGVSTITLLYLVWYIKYNSNKNIVLLGESKRLSHIRKRLKEQLKEQGIKVSSLSRNKVDATSTECSIFYAPSLKMVEDYGTAINKIDVCHYDNFAYAKREDQGLFIKQVELMSEIETVIISSTPLSDKEYVEEKKCFLPTHFYTLCEDAKNGKNDYTYFHISWDAIPSRDEEWRKNMITILGSEEEFNKEYIM